MKKLNRNPFLIAAALIGLMLLTAGQALAADFQGDRQKIQQGLRLTRQHQFAMAKYKYKMVKVDVATLPYSQSKQQLVSALDLVVEKLEDWNLPPYAKIQFVQECHYPIMQALNQLERGRGGGRLHLNSLNDTFSGMQKVQQKVDQGNYRRAERMLDKIYRFIDSYGYDQKLDQAKMAIDVIKEKINDYNLPPYQKSQITRDCAIEFTKFVQSSKSWRQETGYKALQLNNLNDTFQGMQAVMQDAQAQDYYEADYKLDEIHAFISNYNYEQSLEQAKEAINVIKLKFADGALNHRQKLKIARDCNQAFTNFVQQSQAYQAENYRPRPQPPVYGQETFLGQTSRFSKSRAESQYLNVRGKFKAIKFKAKKSALSVACIEITFANGQKQIVNAFSMYEGQEVTIQLQGHGRRGRGRRGRGGKNITQIHIQATSNTLWGGRGKMNVTGIN